jgi:hypothetical protein
MTPLWSRRGLLMTALGAAGWLLLIPVVLLTQGPPLGGSWVSLPLWLAVLLLAALVSTAAVLFAVVKRSWGVALAALVLAAAGLVVTIRNSSQIDYVGYQYRTHRTALAALAEDYRAGHLHGDLTLPGDVRPLCRSGFAYATDTALFVQLWQNWRAESGTGLAYFPTRPGPATSIPTAEGDLGQPRRELGDGWWWVA